MTGKIMKGIGGFYYVYVEGSGLYECRARGIFRNKKMKPNVGDVVDIDILSEEEKTGNLIKIYKRKNQLIRPMAANVDQALVIFAVHEPEPNFHLLNRFLITMEQQEIPVIICFNKTDLATTEQMQQLEKDSFIQIIMGVKPVSYFDTFVKEWYEQGGEELTEQIRRSNPGE